MDDDDDYVDPAYVLKRRPADSQESPAAKRARMKTVQVQEHFYHTVGQGARSFDTTVLRPTGSPLQWDHKAVKLRIGCVAVSRGHLWRIMRSLEDGKTWGWTLKEPIRTRYLRHPTGATIHNTKRPFLFLSPDSDMPLCPLHFVHDLLERVLSCKLLPGAALTLTTRYDSLASWTPVEHFNTPRALASSVAECNRLLREQEPPQSHAADRRGGAGLPYWMPLPKTA